MKQNATEKLEERQERALLLLVEGKTDTEVANEIGVDRTTIYRWKNDNPLFIAELNRLRSSLWAASEEKLLKARLKAVEAVIEMLESDDDRIKMKAVEMVLRMKLGAPNGPTTVATAQSRIDLSKLIDSLTPPT